MNVFTRIIIALSIPFQLLVRTIKKVPKYRNTFKKQQTWYKHKVAGCVSSDGSPYYVYLKKGKVNKTVVYFSGGGASWDEYTAANPTTVGRLLRNKEGYYFPFVPFYMEGNMKGLLAEKDGRNPVDEWNFIYLPYSTGDFHIGNRDFPYKKGSKRKILYHHGRRNVEEALKSAPREFFEAEEVFIGGESAGAFASIAWAPGLMSYFKKCRHFVVYSDSAQIKSGKWHDILKNVWETAPDYYNCLDSDGGQLVHDWFIRAHKALKGKGLLLHSISSHDGILAAYENRLNGGAYKAEEKAIQNFHEGLKESVLAMAKEIPEYRYYIFNHGRDKDGATAHTIARSPRNLYEDKNDGISVGEWLRNAVSGKEVKNVGAGNLN